MRFKFNTSAIAFFIFQTSTLNRFLDFQFSTIRVRELKTWLAILPLKYLA